MTTIEPSAPRIPVICADPSAVVGAVTFNPNPWSGASRGIVLSCWTEYSVLHHCVGQIAELCARSDQQCQRHLDTLQQRWRVARFDLQRVIVFGQVPDLHMRIESFFAGIKTLLDLLAQLLSSERIVAAIVDGFHRAQDVYGGKVLNALENNALGNRRVAAAKIRELILEHKTLWIDEAIRARDQLIHPERGMHQLMFQFDLVARGDTLMCERIQPPMIGAEAIDAYAWGALKHAESFSAEFLKVLREDVAGV
jgi:hypothetical protein